MGAGGRKGIKSRDEGESVEKEMERKEEEKIRRQRQVTVNNVWKE